MTNERTNSLTKTVSSIETLYKKLCELEIKQKKDTFEFSKTLDYLSIALEVENKTIEILNRNDCGKWIEHFSMQEFYGEMLNDIESLIHQNYNDRISRRIFNMLFYKIMNELDYDDKDNINDDIVSNTVKIDEALKKDRMKFYLIFLNEFINNEEYYDDKKYLIKAKYNAVFINKSIEKYMMLNKFKLPKKTYFSSESLASELKIDKDLYRILRNSFGLELAVNQIQEILKEDYSNDTILPILRQCLLRTSFLFLDEENLIDLNLDFLELLDKNYIDNEVGKQLVIESFNNVCKDRSKTKSLIR